MNKLNRILLLAVLSISGSAKAQILIGDAPLTLNFNNLNTDYGGAFDATGGSNLFPLTASASTTIYAGATNPALTTSYNDFSPGGVYSNTGTYSNSNSMRALRDGASNDYALGLKVSADHSFVLRMQNNGTDGISVWTIDYSVEQYSLGGSATDVLFSYSLNGSSFITTNLTGASAVTALTGTDSNLASVSSTARTGVVSELIPVGGEIYFRWTFDYKSVSASHIGIDDVTVTPTAVPEPSMALLSLAAGCVLTKRRRK